MKNFKKTWKKGIGDKLRRLSTPNPIAVLEAQMAAKAAGKIELKTLICLISDFYFKVKCNFLTFRM